MINRSEAIKSFNSLGRAKEPFVFFTDFLGEKVWLQKLTDIHDSELMFAFSSQTNADQNNSKEHKTIIKDARPVSKKEFNKAFDYVVSQINYGNSFLTNLTFQTPISLSASLEEVFHATKAKYKLWFKNEFVCFSPEIFVRIKENRIYSHPMKGTINADVEGASEKLLNNPKETAEHITIVDLIRNDLSQVADNVEVKRFRYLDELVTDRNRLLQMSSEIVGTLHNDWQSSIGDILFKLLPAGSICGAPKPQTLQIIKDSENYDRGFYTGVCGIFNGESLDSGVMIRFIENKKGDYFYKSGGGITSFSQAEDEYQEYLDKIYVPVY